MYYFGNILSKCWVRYNAGLFYLHSLFNDVEYVWRVEPGATYTCDMFQRDPFQSMKQGNKKIGNKHIHTPCILLV